jgi:hypothetical protein
MFTNRAIAFLLVGAVPCLSQSAQPSLTSLLTPEEYRRAGLSKLTTQEIQALDAALLKIVIALGTARTATVSPTADGVGSETEFFDSRGAAVAYFDDDETLYLWSGEPVAYRDEDSLVGFNGSHLAWIHEGGYDHDGNLVAAIAARFSWSVQTKPFKGLRELRPLKSLRELRPLRPLWGTAWSQVPGRSFLLQGIS